MVKVIESPGQDNSSAASYEGVTVMVASSGDVPAVASKVVMLPVPLAANPILVLSFVQLYIVVPFSFAVLNTISAISSPLQTTIGSIPSTCAVGLTVIVKVSDGPEQLSPAFV